MNGLEMPYPKQIAIICCGAFIVLGLVSCEATTLKLGIFPTSTSLPDPHNHARYPHQGKSGFLDSVNEVTEILFQEPPPGSIVEESILNDVKSHQAYLLLEPNPYDPSGTSYHFGIYVKEVSTGTYFKLQGMHSPARPVFGLIWIGSKYLVFDITSNPHYGFHFVFDIETMEFIYVTPMLDDDF